MLCFNIKFVYFPENFLTVSVFHDFNLKTAIFGYFSERSEAAEGSRARQAEGRAYDRARELGRREWTKIFEDHDGRTDDHQKWHDFKVWFPKFFHIFTISIFFCLCFFKVFFEFFFNEFDCKNLKIFSHFCRLKTIMKWSKLFLHSKVTKNCFGSKTTGPSAFGINIIKRTTLKINFLH